MAAENKNEKTVTDSSNKSEWSPRNVWNTLTEEQKQILYIFIACRELRNYRKEIATKKE